MSKMNKVQTAGTVCKEGAAATVGGAVGAINEAAKELGDLPRSQDYGRIVGIAQAVTESMEFGLGKVCVTTDRERLADAFANAVGLLHKAVCRRDGDRLRMSMREVNFQIPFTQRLDMAANGISMTGRGKVRSSGGCEGLPRLRDENRRAKAVRVMCA